MHSLGLPRKNQQLWAQFAAAAAGNHVHTVRFLLSVGVPVDCDSAVYSSPFDYRPRTALLMTIERKQHAMVQLLLNSGASVQFYNWLPLEAAFRTGDLEIVQMLWNQPQRQALGSCLADLKQLHGSLLEFVGKCLIAAAAGGHSHVLQYIFQQHSHYFRWCVLGSAHAILKAAVHAGDIATVICVLDALTPQDLVHLNCDPRPMVPGRILDAALEVACRDGHLPIVHLLVERGANVNGGTYNTSPLANAVLSKHTHVVQALLQLGAIADWNRDFALRQTCCTDVDNIEVVQMLLAAGADVQNLDANDVSNLCYTGLVDTLRIFQATKRLRTLSNGLEMAVQYGRESVVSLLLNGDMLPSELGQTPLLVLAASSSPGIMQQLLETPRCSWTVPAMKQAEQAAAVRGNSEMVGMLQSKIKQLEATNRTA